MSTGTQNGKRKYFGEQFLAFDPSSHKVGWVLSYADMMTIILTFMILLLSISTIAQTRFDLLVEALTGQKVGNLQQVKIKIDKVIKQEQLGGEVSTKIDEHGLKIEFSNALLFPSGEADLTERGNAVFEPIAHHLVADLEPAYGLVVEGYTDDVPISNSRYHSNWELSTSRAIHVMRRLTELGLDRRRMSVQGFADTRAATDVDLHDGEELARLSPDEIDRARAANRRVVIRIDRLDSSVLERILGADAPTGTTPAAEQPAAPAPGETIGPRPKTAPAPADIPGMGSKREEKR